MTNTKHTPGPWHVVVDESAAQVTGFPCIKALEYTIVGTEGMFGDIDIDFANAHLIAAAPDMLDTLERLDRWFDTDHEILDAMTPDVRADHERQHQMIRAAIAKAKGES